MPDINELEVYYNEEPQENTTEGIRKSLEAISLIAGSIAVVHAYKYGGNLVNIAVSFGCFNFLTTSLYDRLSE